MPRKGESIIERLSQSRIYRDYEQAFGAATGLPLNLRAIETLNLVQRGKKHENPFCVLMAGQHRACAACLRVQERLARNPGPASRTVTCFAGLCDTAVPVQAGGKRVGFLQTGQVLLKKPDRRQFRRTARQLLDWGANVDLQKLEDAYFHTRVLSPAQYRSLIRLLEIFGQHLSLLGTELLVREQAGESGAIRNARRYIEQHQAGKISLGEVARAVNTSTFYFCRMFKKATGLNFTDYLSRVRIEKARNLLLNPNARVSEVAFAVGFQSLTHFNRVFKRITGSSPSAFRRTRPLLLSPARSEN